MATNELNEPQVFTKSLREDFHQDTPKRPYLTFKLGPGELQRLVINIWSNDQGWCDDHLKTDDPYANSDTWFSLGIVEEPISGHENQSELHEFQRNVRALSTMRCHTNQWNLGIPAEDNCNNEVHAWIESTAQAEGSVVAVFPLARYRGWVNTVWKVEVLVYSKAGHVSPFPEPQAGLGHDDNIDVTVVSPRLSVVTAMSLEEEGHVMNYATERASKDCPERITSSDEVASEVNNRYKHEKALCDLEEAISVARQAVEATPGDHADRDGWLSKLGSHLCDRYSRTGAMEDLEEAIQISRQVVESTTEDHADWAVNLNSLGIRLRERYLSNGTMADLEEAIRIAGQAVEATPEDHPDQPRWLNNLGIIIHDRYLRTGAMADLERAIRISRQVVKTIPDDHPDWAGLLNNLGIHLGDRCSRTGAMEDLEEAIQIARQVVESTPEDYTHWAAWLSNLGSHLQDRYSRTGATADLEEAIRIARQAVEATPTEHPGFAERLGSLGSYLNDRYLRTGGLADLQEAISTARQATKTIPKGHPNRATLLGSLGNHLSDMYSRTGATENLEEAIQISRQAIEATPGDHPDRAGRLSNLGSHLQDRYSRTGATADLEEAIRITRQAVEATPEDHPDRPRRLNNLGTKLGNRYSRTGATVDLEEAIHITRQAIEATPEDHPDWIGLLNNLGLHLGNRYSRTGATVDLEEAIHITRQAIEATPENHPDFVMRLNNLGIHLEDRYSRTGTMADLEEAIRIARQAIKAVQKDHPHETGLLDSLSSRLRKRYLSTGVLADLEEALQTSRQAVNAIPEDHPKRVALLNNLSNTLGNRYLSTGALVDVEEAIRISKRAIETIPEDHPDRIPLLNNLGVHLTDRYLRTATMMDLEEAIRIGRQVVEATPEDHPDRPRWLNNLGARLGDRYSHTGTIADLDEAIRISRQAVEATPEDHLGRARSLTNLGNRLGDKYSRTGAMEDLEEAIRIARQSVEAAPQNHSDGAAFLSNLAVRLHDRHTQTGNMVDLEELHKISVTILSSTGGRMRARIFAGRNLLSNPPILQRGCEGYWIARTAVELVPLSAPFSLQSADKQYHLSQAVGLASDAAAVTLHVGQGLVPAIELLETGRGVIASSLQDIRTDLSSLQEEHPELARSFTDLRDLLDTPTSSGTLNMTSPVTLPSATVDQRHQANSQMTALLNSIRLQPGFETFLMAATETQMREAAAQGPIVIINVSRHRCDALIIEQAGIQALQLHQLTRENIISRAGQLKSLQTLCWIWTVIAKPVLDTLGFTKTPPNDDSWPHVWWIPTGPLVRFPLHAAGHHLKGNSETVLDRVVSSYASSVKSIINTRQQPQKPTRNQDLQVVLVAMQKTPSQSVLHHATNEVDTVRGICTSIGAPYCQPQPYQKAVLDDLNSCRVFHFAGHGSTHPKDPLQSRLLLKDWEDNPLSVGNLLDKTNLRSSSPFLAYLSACGTGQVLDDKSVDESIHLTSAFQLAGFRHVIGTLWEVDDALCVDMARMTYEFMSEEQFSDGSVAYGLHHAMRTLRDQWAGKVGCSEVKQKRDAILITDTVQGTPMWVPYVHYGV